MKYLWLWLSLNCVITKKKSQGDDPNTNTPVPENRVRTGVTFKIKETKLYVPVVNLRW